MKKKNCSSLPLVEIRIVNNKMRLDNNKLNNSCSMREMGLFVDNLNNLELIGEAIQRRGK